MTRKRNNRRIMGDDGWTYRCSLCQDYLPNDHFHKDNSKPPFYLSYNCKKCRKDISNRKPDPELVEHKNIILNKMGYDVEDNIHEQFIRWINERKIRQEKK
jgi:DNA-directed RNA polymerase subunit RPC12/RpoP